MTRNGLNNDRFLGAFIPEEDVSQKIFLHGVKGFGEVSEGHKQFPVLLQHTPVVTADGSMIFVLEYCNKTGIFPLSWKHCRTFACCSY